MKIASAAQMSEIDRIAVEQYKIPSVRLMENAAEGIFRAAMEYRPKTAAVMVGGGKNGGDGLAAARLLIKALVEVRVFMPGERRISAADTAEMEKKLFEYGGEIESFTGSDEQIEFLENCDIIIDAMFGTGLNRPLSGAYLAAVELVNRLARPVVSADIPSGIDADSGEPLGCAVRAQTTVTFTLPKPAHFLMPSKEYCGKLVVHDIGIPQHAVAGMQIDLTAADDDYLDMLVKPRQVDTHKGSFGKLLMVCGSEGYTGAAALAAMSAVRSGAGMVFLGVPERIYAIEAVKLVEPVVFPLSDDKAGRLSIHALDVILEMMSKCGAALIGPGLSRSDDITEIVREVVKNSRIPLVVDADGINALTGNIDLLRSVDCPVVLTPHDAEFSRLFGRLPKDGERLCCVRDFAAEYGVTILLKGHRTITAAPDRRAVINTTGNPGMAKGGSGDVLSGIIASLLAQGFGAFEAAAAGAFIHGRAGDIAANVKGEYSMTPSDMVMTLPEVLKKFNSREW